MHPVVHSRNKEMYLYKRMQNTLRQGAQINYYDNQKLLINIDGMNKIDEIYKEIRQIMASLKT